MEKKNRSPLSEEQLLTIKELAGHIAWNWVWVDETPGPPWEGSVLFVIEGGPGRTMSISGYEALVKGVREQLGHDDFFIESIEGMNPQEMGKMRQISSSL